MVILGEVQDEPDVEAQVSAASAAVGSGVEELCAQGRKLGKMSLQLPAKVAIVAIACTWIEPVTAAAVAGPRSDALLQP